MAGTRMRRVEPMEDTTASEAPPSTPTQSPDIVQSPTARRVELTPAQPPTPSDFVTSLGNKPADDEGLSLVDLIRDRPAPEVDLVQCGYRLPRYLREAVRLTALRLGVPEQDVVARLALNDRPTHQLFAKIRNLTYRRANGTA